jgi:excisionase family DNA binding protein
VSAASRDASVCVEPIFDADRIKGHHLSESNPKCRSSQFGSINGRRIVPSILHCLLSRQILSREQGTACLARLQNNRLPIALKPFPHRVFGVYDRTFDNWTCYHNIIYSLSFFIRFNCVSESPSHSLLTVKETAEYLRIPLPTVYYLVQRGQIPAIQIGGRWRIKKSSLDRDILREDKQGQPTVLVVDDDPGIQELFKTFLKKTGFSRVVVGTAKEAISNLRKQKFDLMFLDLQLPDEPGDQVYKAAKQIDPGLNVIVITGYPDSKVLDRILQISPVTVLKKPLKIEQLNQTVRMLGHKAPLVEA